MTDTTSSEPFLGERTIETALDAFTLRKQHVGSIESREACAMAIVSFINGDDELKDHPDCTAPWLADIVIRGFDALTTTAVQGLELTKAAARSAIDTHWVPAPALILAVACAPRPDVAGAYEHAMGVLELIDQWKAEGRPFINLTGANLTGANLTGAYLTGAYLARANLPGAYLAGAYLAGANLARAYLAGANLARANLARANLTGANLTGAYLTGANLTGAYLAGAYLAGANLPGAYLAGAYLAGAYLAGAYLAGANLARAYLAGANLTGANLTGANLTGANLARANLARANLTGANLTGATGNASTVLPSGWLVNDKGLIVPVGDA